MLDRTKRVGVNTDSQFCDRPFGCPADIVIDLPIPPSVNKSRRINWAARKDVTKWVEQCDALFMVRKHDLRKQAILGRYKITIIYDENKLRIDPDNGIKSLQDLMRRYALIVDDSKRFCRGISIEYGEAPEGARVVLQPVA